MPGEHVRVILGPALRDWKGTLRYALTNAAQAYKVELARYPQQNEGSTYRRTHVLGKTARGEVEDLSVKLEAVQYSTYVLFPPQTEFIVPKEKPVLAWQGSDGTWHHAKKVRRVWWSGKLDAVRTAIVKGFVGGLKKALAEGRRL